MDFVFFAVVFCVIMDSLSVVVLCDLSDFLWFLCLSVFLSVNVIVDFNKLLGSRYTKLCYPKPSVGGGGDSNKSKKSPRKSGDGSRRSKVDKELIAEKSDSGWATRREARRIALDRLRVLVEEKDYKERVNLQLTVNLTHSDSCTNASRLGNFLRAPSAFLCVRDGEEVVTYFRVSEFGFGGCCMEDNCEFVDMERMKGISLNNILFVDKSYIALNTKISALFPSYLVLFLDFSGPFGSSFFSSSLFSRSSYPLRRSSFPVRQFVSGFLAFNVRLRFVRNELICSDPSYSSSARALAMCGVDNFVVRYGRFWESAYISFVLDGLLRDACGFCSGG